jgi:hypothetical protein
MLRSTELALLRFKFLKALLLKLRDVMPCLLANTYRRFGGACYLRIVGNNQSTRRNIPKNYLFHWHTFLFI